ncbi:hypothetical protein [Olivibacter sp. XZL3]|uniref:hypothetical protein n=1 Tax=Olivibacter sp. XZL3 TaxID=1735116 RepID=UPI0010664365|nr:hypothetical protein [Olivibacter sp. XZL3]
MDTAILVEDLYEKGKELIIALDKQGISVPTAFLMRISEEDYNWSLVLAMEGVKDNGSRQYYQKILSTIQENGIPLSLADIRVIDKDEETIRALQRMIHTGNTISRINFFGNYINGQRFPDSVIYRAS